MNTLWNSLYCQIIWCCSKITTTSIIKKMNNIDAAKPLPLLNPKISRPIMSKAGPLAWYEENIIKEPIIAGILFSNRVLLLSRKIRKKYFKNVSRK